jgi:hypothetical protein
MRAAVILVAAAGCLSAPTGLDQAWPPPRGIAVEAVVAADLDGDATPELLVLASGTSHEAGIYRIEGNRDLDLGTPALVRGFSTFAPLPLVHPSAVVATATGVFEATATNDKIEIQALTNALAPVGQRFDAGFSSGNTVLWLRAATFPGDMPRIVASNGSLVTHVAPDGSDSRMIPPPSGATWSTAEVATTYSIAGEPHLVVATPGEIWDSPLTGGAFAWTNRRSGAAWLGQIAVDLDGDGRDEIVGFDPAAHAACMFDVVAAAPQCAQLFTTWPGTEVTIAVGQLDAGPGLDLAIAQATEVDTGLSVLSDFVVQPGSFAGMIAPASSTSLGHGRLVVVNAGPGTPDSALVVGDDGKVECVAGGC